MIRTDRSYSTGFIVRVFFFFFFLNKKEEIFIYYIIFIYILTHRMDMWLVILKYLPIENKFYKKINM